MSHREALFGSSNNQNNSSNTAKSNQPLCTYKWILRGEFIQLESNPNLVIGLPDTEVTIVWFFCGGFNLNGLLLCKDSLSSWYCWVLCWVLPIS